MTDRRLGMVHTSCTLGGANIWLATIEHDKHLLPKLGFERVTYFTLVSFARLGALAAASVTLDVT